VRSNLRGVLGWLICAPVLSALVYVVARPVASIFLAKKAEPKSQ
jgi:hypothetical protein